MQKSGLRFLLAGFLCTGPAMAQNGIPKSSRPVVFQNSPRVHELIRAGSLYLSLQDALALAIENNLDIELQRFTPEVAAADLLRAKGGGTVRGLNFTLAEVPTGVGGPLSPVLTNPAVSTSVTGGSSVTTNALELGLLGAPQTNLSIQGTVPQSTGTAVPIYDPAIIGQLNWSHQTTPQSNSVVTGTPSLITNGLLANAGIQQGFSTGALASLTFNK